MTMFNSLSDSTSTRFEILTAMKIHVVVFWILIPCSDVVGYHHIGGLCCLILQGEVK
jgi:hypothetical protein